MSLAEFAAEKAADIAYPAMVAAWWAAIATTLASIFAAVAVWWARRAAIEASKQARAAIESAGWSRKAAEAAQRQIGLLEKQLAYSEPQPMVIIDVTKHQLPSGPYVPAFTLENIGDAPAFDVEVSSLVSSYEPITNKMTFHHYSGPRNSDQAIS